MTAIRAIPGKVPRVDPDAYVDPAAQVVGAVTIEAGHYHLVQTPEGIRKEAKSIAWANMDEDTFGQLYRDVFAACWRLVLSAHFETEADAQVAADQLGSFA